jgi:hypothetical protein
MTNGSESRTCFQRTSSSQDEGRERDWAVLTNRAVGNGADVALECARVAGVKGTDGRCVMRAIRRERVHLAG